MDHIKMILDGEYDSLCAKNHHIHNEIYCKYCENYIRDNISTEKFCDLEGFVSVHNTQFGKCIVMIDLETSNPIRNCSIEYLSNNTIENGLNGTLEYISNDRQ